MKWKSHKAIAKAISNSLGLPNSLAKALSNGSIEPDKKPDIGWRTGRKGRLYRARIRHHFAIPPYNLIMDYIWKARFAYLMGNDMQAMGNLGRALHYIQDSSVNPGFLYLSHDSLEDQLLSGNFPYHSIIEGINAAICSPHFIKNSIMCLKPRNNVSEILDQASRYSALVVKSVIGDKTPSTELLEKHKSSRVRYYKRTVPVSIGVFSAFLYASIILLYYSFAFVAFVIFLLGSGISLSNLYSAKFRYYKKELKWFGIQNV